jgi:hypothetical protein
MSISEGVGAGGTTTMSGIPTDLAVVAAVAACPIVESVPAQLCPSQLQSFSESQGNQECAPKYLVQCGPNTGSLISNLPPYRAASVQYVIKGEGTVDWAQKYASKGGSSKVCTSITSILSKAFKGSGSNTRQEFEARGNQFGREVQLLSYLGIRIW